MDNKITFMSWIYLFFALIVIVMLSVFAFNLLNPAPATPVVPPTPLPREGFVLETNVNRLDIPVNTFNTSTVDTESQCQNLCRDVPNCTGYQYSDVSKVCSQFFGINTGVAVIKPRNSTINTYLKSATTCSEGLRLLSTGVVVEDGIKRVGGSTRVVPNADNGECVMACMTDDTCAGGNYNRITGVCTLSESTNPQIWTVSSSLDDSSFIHTFRCTAL